MQAKARFALLLSGVMLFAGTSASPRLLSTQEILELVNRDRASQGLPNLVINPTLNLAALAKAQDMMSKDYFAHTSPEGKAPWYWFKALGYNYSYAGENLAEGFSDPNDLENSWMASPEHRANILSPFYSDVGLAVITENNLSLVVQLFGSKNHEVSLRQ